MDPTCETPTPLIEILESLEAFLESSINLHIPEGFSKDPITRAQSILKMLMTFERSNIVYVLPQLLELLESPDCYKLILDLLESLLASNSEEILEIVAQSAENTKIKKQCLKVIKDLIEKAEMQGLHRVMHSLAGVLNDPDREVSTLAREVGRKIRDSIFRTIPPVRITESSDLAFGVIPLSLLNEFTTTKNKKGKIIALKSIEESLINSNNFHELETHELEIVQFLADLLIDSSNTFINIALKIASHLTLRENFNMARLNNILKGKLGDSSISVRHGAFRVILHNFKFCPHLGEDLIIGLENDNWHIREETVCLFIAGLLRNYDFSKLDLIEKFCKLLDDDKSKIRQAVFEAFAVLGKIEGKDKVIEKIQGMVDELTLKNIQERMELDKLAEIKNGLLHMPQITPNSAPLHFTARKSFSPFPTPTSTQDMHFDFVPISSANSPKHRSSSLTARKTEGSSIFRQSAELVKPPLPIRKASPKTLPPISKDDTTPNTVIDKTYTDFRNLQPLSSPGESLKNLLSITTDNWESQFDHTDLIRRLIKFHKDLLNTQNVHSIIIQLLKWGDSLRSALSKNSLIALGDFCRELPKHLDPDIDSIMTLLLRKTIDTNIFIAETSVDSLTLCVTNCSLGRLILTILSQMSQAKSGALKSKIAYCCKFVLQRVTAGPLPGGIDRIVISLASYLQDAAPEVRTSARECFISLGKDADKILMKFLTENMYKSVKDILEKDAKKRTILKSTEFRRTSSISINAKNHENENPDIGRSRERERQNNAKSSARSSTLGSALTRSTNRLRISDNFERDLSVINEINSALMNEDWKVRFRTIEKISAGILEDVEANQNNNKILSLIDALCRAITDQNSKVSMQSLATLKELVPKLKWALKPNLGLLISSVVVTLGSSSLALRNASKDICEIVMENCEPVYIIGPFISAVNVANPRAKTVLINCVNEVVEEAYRKKPNLVKKYAVPLMYRIVDDPNPEVKEQAERFIFKVKDLLGEDFLKNAPEKKIDKIRRIIDKKNSS